MSTSECSPRKRVIIGISGASGFLYGVQALRYLRQLNVESHVVISPAAHLTRSLETTLSEDDVHELADVIYPFDDIAADIASGSRDVDCPLFYEHPRRCCGGLNQQFAGAGSRCNPERAPEAGSDGP